MKAILIDAGGVILESVESIAKTVKEHKRIRIQVDRIYQSFGYKEWSEPACSECNKNGPPAL